jgi:hypothetical protein
MRIANDVANDLRLYVPFTKREAQDDGSVVVSGIATAEEIDKQGEVVSYDASRLAFEEWTDAFSRMTDGASLGNIREMHGPVAAGKAIAWEPFDERKAIGLTARIYGDAAVKVRESVLNGFSIGAPGSSVKREIRKIGDKDVPTITAYRLSEVSVVDNPAAPSATFSVVKRAVPITWTAGLVKNEIEAGRLTVDPRIVVGDLPIEDGHRAVAAWLNDGTAAITADRVIAPCEKAAPAAAEPEAEPQFADPANKKFPLDTPRRIKAAWKGINTETVAAKYSKRDGAAIKRLIVKAWKQQVDKAGPPAEVTDKCSDGGAVSKSCWDIRRAIDIRMEIDSILSQEIYENAMEHPEPPEQLTALAEALAALDRFIVSETNEVFSESETADSESASEDGMKADELQAMFSSEITKAFSTLPTTDAIKAMLGDFTKAAEDAAKKSADDAVAPVVASIEGIEKRLATVEATPAAAGVPVHAAEKSIGPGAPVVGSAVPTESLTSAESVLKAMEQLEASGQISDHERTNFTILKAALAIGKRS